MKYRCVKDLGDQPTQLFDGPMFAQYWLEPWFLGYPDTEIELESEIKKKDEKSEVGEFYRSLYSAIPTRVQFFDPSARRSISVLGFLAVIPNHERIPVILFSLEEVSSNRYIGYVHSVYEKEN